jgi:hypothetical protein
MFGLPKSNLIQGLLDKRSIKRRSQLGSLTSMCFSGFQNMKGFLLWMKFVNLGPPHSLVVQYVVNLVTRSCVIA